MISTFRGGIYRIGGLYFGFLDMRQDTYVLRLLKGDEDFFLYECEKKVTRIRRPLERIAVDELLNQGVVMYGELGEKWEDNVEYLGNSDKLVDILQSYNSSRNDLPADFDDLDIRKLNLRAGCHDISLRERFSQRFDKAIPWVFWLAFAGTIGAGVSYLVGEYLKRR